MEKICKTCGWSIALDGPTNPHNCHCPKIEYTYKPENDGLAYMDSECYSATFVVGPNFGCIHWLNPVED